MRRQIGARNDTATQALRGVPMNFNLSGRSYLLWGKREVADRLGLLLMVQESPPKVL